MMRILDWLDGVPRDPFDERRKPLWLPREMREAPPLLEEQGAGTVQRRLALLINPFYAKSPHGSFGKHVLTPTLALTSVAGATPKSWEVRYWDENLLQGPPPADPVPEVVGICDIAVVKAPSEARAKHAGCHFKQVYNVIN